MKKTRAQDQEGRLGKGAGKGEKGRALEACFSKAMEAGRLRQWSGLGMGGGDQEGGEGQTLSK